MYTIDMNSFQIHKYETIKSHFNIKKTLLITLILLTLSPSATNAQKNCQNSLEQISTEYVCNSTNEHGEWLLVFEDQFNGEKLDTSYWYTCEGGWDSIRPNELQCYKQTNVKVQNGMVHLIATTDTGSCTDWHFGETDDSSYTYQHTYYFSSGWISSKFRIKYGKIEVRCKIPEGDALWPAFWLYGSKREVDIFEFCGNDPYTIHTAIHNWYNEDTNIQCNKSTYTETPLSADFHTYALEWDEFKLIFSIDGEVIRTDYQYYDYDYGIRLDPIADCDEFNNSQNNIYGDTLFPNGPMDLILNLAISDSCSECYCKGQIVNPEDLPASMIIDYVRIYKRTNPNMEVSICGFSQDSSTFITGNNISIAPTDCISVSNKMHLYANQQITFLSGFCAEKGSTLTANIIPSNSVQAPKNQAIQHNPENHSNKEVDDEPFTIYPNPAKGLLHISQDGSECLLIRIITPNGTVVYTSKRNPEKEFTIDISHLKNGIYYITAHYRNDIITKKIIIL